VGEEKELGALPNKVLLTTDGSEDVVLATRRAPSRRRAARKKLHLVHV
jgi:hypothetical protein